MTTTRTRKVVSLRAGPSALSLVVLPHKAAANFNTLLERAAGKLGFALADVAEVRRDKRGCGTSKEGTAGHDPFDCCTLLESLQHGDSFEVILREPVHSVHAAQATKAAVAPAQVASPQLSSQPCRERRRRRKHERRLTVRELRKRAIELQTELISLGAVITPVPDEEKPEGARKPACELERQGHGKGDTKNYKKRRHRENRAVLGRLVLHWERLLLDTQAASMSTGTASGESGHAAVARDELQEPGWLFSSSGSDYSSGDDFGIF